MRLAIALLAVALSASEPAKMINGRCSVCIKTGQTSTITIGHCIVSLNGGTAAHFDEAGKFYARVGTPDVITTCQWNCSRGHVIYVPVERRKPEVPK